jgi:hypothetical protein
LPSAPKAPVTAMTFPSVIDLLGRASGSPPLSGRIHSQCCEMPRPQHGQNFLRFSRTNSHTHDPAPKVGWTRRPPNVEPDPPPASLVWRPEAPSGPPICSVFPMSMGQELSSLGKCL